MLNEQVTHHEYEVETSNGRTITKKRKTRSTVLFEACICFSLNAIKPIHVHMNYISTPHGLASKCRLLICLKILNFSVYQDPRKQKINTPKTNTPRTVVKVMNSAETLLFIGMSFVDCF